MSSKHQKTGSNSSPSKENDEMEIEEEDLLRRKQPNSSPLLSNKTIVVENSSQIEGNSIGSQTSHPRFDVSERVRQLQINNSNSKVVRKPSSLTSFEERQQSKISEQLDSMDAQKRKDLERKILKNKNEALKKKEEADKKRNPNLNLPVDPFIYNPQDLTVGETLPPSPNPQIIPNSLITPMISNEITGSNQPNSITNASTNQYGSNMANPVILGATLVSSSSAVLNPNRNDLLLSVTPQSLTTSIPTTVIPSSLTSSLIVDPKSSSLINGPIVTPIVRTSSSCSVLTNAETVSSNLTSSPVNNIVESIPTTNSNNSSTSHNNFSLDNSVITRPTVMPSAPSFNDANMNDSFGKDEQFTPENTKWKGLDESQLLAFLSDDSTIELMDDQEFFFKVNLTIPDMNPNKIDSVFSRYGKILKVTTYGQGKDKVAMIFVKSEDEAERIKKEYKGEIGPIQTTKALAFRNIFLRGVFIFEFAPDSFLEKLNEQDYVEQITAIITKEMNKLIEEVDKDAKFEFRIRPHTRSITVYGDNVDHFTKLTNKEREIYVPEAMLKIRPMHYFFATNHFDLKKVMLTPNPTSNGKIAETGILVMFKRLQSYFPLIKEPVAITIYDEKLFDGSKIKRGFVVVEKVLGEMLVKVSKLNKKGAVLFEEPNGNDIKRFNTPRDNNYEKSKEKEKQNREQWIEKFSKK